MTEQTLFNLSPPEDPPPVRDTKRIIAQVFERADAKFLATHTDVLIEYGHRHTDWIAGEITAAHEAKYGKLGLRAKKQLGGLYQQLQKDGVIERTGEYRQRSNHNMTAAYRLRG